MQFMVEELRYAQLDTPFVKNLKPYSHQTQTLAYIRDAIAGLWRIHTVCIGIVCVAQFGVSERADERRSACRARAGCGLMLGCHQPLLLIRPVPRAN